MDRPKKNSGAQDVSPPGEEENGGWNWFDWGMDVNFELPSLADLPPLPEVQMGSLLPEMKLTVPTIAMPEVNMTGLFNNYILPLYKEVKKARSIVTDLGVDDTIVDFIGAAPAVKAKEDPVQSYILVREDKDREEEETKATSEKLGLYVRQKAYRVVRQKAYKSTEQYSACLVKRFKNCTFGHPPGKVVAGNESKTKKKGKNSSFNNEKGLTIITNVVVENEIQVMTQINDCPYVHKLLDVLIPECEGTSPLKETWLKLIYPDEGCLADMLASTAEFTAAYAEKESAGTPGSDRSNRNKLMITMQQVAAIGCQIVRALEFIHVRKIVHGDLTTKNIVIWPPGVVKLTNFESAVDYSEIEQDPSKKPDLLHCERIHDKLQIFLDSDLQVSSKSLYCSAPEKLLLGLYATGKNKEDEVLTSESIKSLASEWHNSKVDIWSFGILLLELVLHVPPLYRACEGMELEDEEGKTIVRSSREIAKARSRYVNFVTDLRTRTTAEKCGSALHHLFYPHYDLVKQQMAHNIPLDLDVFKDNLPQLETCPIDSLVILMGHRDESKRYETPEQMKPEKIPRFEGMYSISSFFDLVRQCLFIPNEARPTAEALSKHTFLQKPYKELEELEPHLDDMIEEYKTRDGRKKMDLTTTGKVKKRGRQKGEKRKKPRYIFSLTVLPIYMWMVQVRKQRAYLRNA